MINYFIGINKLCIKKIKYNLSYVKKEFKENKSRTIKINSES